MLPCPASAAGQRVPVADAHEQKKRQRRPRGLAVITLNRSLNLNGRTRNRRDGNRPAAQASRGAGLPGSSRHAVSRLPRQPAPQNPASAGSGLRRPRLAAAAEKRNVVRRRGGDARCSCVMRHAAAAAAVANRGGGEDIARGACRVRVAHCPVGRT